MKKKISIDEVQKIAQLARLHLTDNDMKDAIRYLEDILGYVDKLSSVKTDNVEPYDVPATILGELRPDTEHYVPDKQRLVEGERFTKNGLLRTKGVFKKNNDA